MSSRELESNSNGNKIEKGLAEPTIVQYHHHTFIQFASSFIDFLALKSVSVTLSLSRVNNYTISLA